MVRLFRINVLLIWVASLLFIGCKTDSSKKDGNAEDDMELEDLRPGEIVHDTLSDKQLSEIRRIHSAFSEVMKNSLEETIDNFRRDQHPDREIAIWLQMATAYEQFALNKHIEEYDKKQEAFELLLLRSMASEEEVLKKYTVNYLSKDEVKEIFSYYTEPPRPVTIRK